MTPGLSGVLPFLLLLQPAPRPAKKAPLPHWWVMARTLLASDAHHNAGTGKKRYCLTEGSFADSWTSARCSTPSAISCPGGSGDPEPQKGNPS